MITQKSDVAIIHEAIVAQNTSIMSAALQAKMDVLYEVDDLIKAHGAPRTVTAYIMEKHGCSRNQAMNYYNEAQELFGSSFRNSRKYWIGVQMERINLTKQKALEAGELKVAAQCDANLTKVIEMMSEDTKFDFTQLQVPTLIISATSLKENVDGMTEEEIEKAMRKYKRKRKQNRYQDAEDIDHEEV